MKKFLIYSLSIVLVALAATGCGGATQRESEGGLDSRQISDSLARIESMLKQIEKAHEDSLRLDSIREVRDSDNRSKN